ncbi:DUF397 domain-containing protein [Glycomyces buryatensis]|uniref:DUF397 domain-containing protein n=1 Tax=Glycomyces buryatensis TaxID=2570927 RepID=A0A4S8QJ65_9ACTN|nr:DUF397 domain-containing protein [Glycomyces buryatensis]THV43302.1 DUF397 domain-containing protein [Glycomyces buryatensis]
MRAAGRARAPEAEIGRGEVESSRSDSGSNGQCVAIAVLGGEVAVGDTKTPVADSYAHLRVSAADLGGLLSGIKSGDIA